MTAPFEISISRSETANYVTARTQGYRVLLTITVIHGFTDPGLFRFRRIGDNQDFFEGICGPADLTDWLLNVPDQQEGVLRLATADLVYPSKDVAIDITNSILLELKTLCQEMAKLQTDMTPSSTSTINSDVP